MFEYLNPKNRTVVGFFLACFSGLVIGLYLIDKGGELMAKTSNLRADLRAYLTYAVAYLGYAICLLTPLATFSWLIWRIVSCHG